MQNSYCDYRNFDSIKDEVKFVLRVGSAHNKGGPADTNIAQILHLSNFSDIKLWFIFIIICKPEQIDIQLRYVYMLRFVGYDCIRKSVNRTRQIAAYKCTFIVYNILQIWQFKM